MLRMPLGAKGHPYAVESPWSRCGNPSAGAGAGDESKEAALLPRILNMTTPQSGHLPFTALRPFFMTSSMASEIGLLALHLTQ